MGESVKAETAKPPRSAFYDLGLRTVSGVTLAVVSLALTYYGGWGFAVLVAVAGQRPGPFVAKRISVQTEADFRASALESRAASRSASTTWPPRAMLIT